MAVIEPPFPRRLGRYVLLERIGRGGMGTVYLGRLRGEEGFEKRVAIKTIRGHAAEDERFRNMFLDELRIASRIEHPHVCSVIDAGSDGDTLFMVMEYCDGLTLAEIRSRIDRRLPYELYARVLADAARGLHAAHDLRDDAGEPLEIVHRDVSPQNVMVLRRGGVKVLDFGIARARHRTTRSETGELKGKLAYISPEQLRREPIDRRADVWALGLVLWEMCLGYHPFEADNAAATLGNVASEPIPDPADEADDLPEALAAVLRSALVRDPERRAKSAAAFADALEEYLYETGRPFGMRQVAEHVAPAFDEETVARETTRRSGPASADARPELEDEKTVEVVDTRRSSVAEAETAPLAASEERAPALHAVDVPEPPTEPATFRWSRPEDPRRARRRWAHVAVASLFVGAAVLAALFAQDASTSAHLESATDRETERAEQRPESAHAAPANSRATRVSDEAGEPGPAAEELGTIMVFDAAEADGDVLVSEPRPAPEAARAHRRDAVAQPPAGRTETGTLSVVAVPNAGVWLDGARIGETPLQSTVVVGRHRLRLETADGRRATRPVRVTPAETARVSVIFDP